MEMKQTGFFLLPKGEAKMKQILQYAIKLLTFLRK